MIKTADEKNAVKILCPVCGKWIGSSYSDAAGHVSLYCKRCKESRIITLNRDNRAEAPK